MLKPSRRHIIKGIAAAAVVASAGKLRAGVPAADAQLEPGAFLQRWVTSDARKTLGSDSELPRPVATEKQRFYQSFSDRFFEQLDQHFRGSAPQTVGDTLTALKSAFTNSIAIFPAGQRVGVTPHLLLDGIARADSDRNDFQSCIVLDGVRAIGENADVRRAVQGKRQDFMAPLRISLEFDNGERTRGATTPIATLGENLPLALETPVANARFGRFVAPGQTAELDASDLFAGVMAADKVKPWLSN